MPSSGISDWSRTGATVVSIAVAAVSVIRWTQSVDDRLGVIDMKLNIFTTQAQAAAENAKIYSAQAADAAKSAREAAVQTQGLQDQQIVETKANRKAIDKQRAAIDDQSKVVTKLKDDMKRQLESFEWRIRMLEEQNRKALEKK